MNNLISIIVPMYNVERYLTRCLDSIVNQTYHNLQIICVNDGSPDNCLSIARYYAKQDSRIIVIDQINQGVSAARNIGLSKAVGDYIMFVDSDDWLDLECCRTVLELALRKDYDVVLWPYRKIFSNRVENQFVYNGDIDFDCKSSIKNGIFKDLIGPSENDLKRPYVLDSKVTVHCKLYKSSLIKKHNIRFIDMKTIGTSEDLLFNILVFNNVDSAYFLNVALYNYLKINENSITTVYKPSLQQQWDNLHKYILKMVDLNKFGAQYKKAYFNRIACSIIGLGLNEMNKESPFYDSRMSILKIVSNRKYEIALAEISIKNMPPHWKLFFICARYKLATPLTLLYLIIHRIILK